MYGIGPGAQNTSGLSKTSFPSKPPCPSSSTFLPERALVMASRMLSTHDRTLAVLSVGYADGYPRALGNGQADR